MKQSRKKQEYRHLPAFILLILANGPAHGGAVHAALSKKLPGYKADTAGLYRALTEMEKNGELKFSWDTSAPGPARKVYALTGKGWDKLADWKKDIEQRLAYLQIFLKSYQRIKKPSLGSSREKGSV